MAKFYHVYLKQKILITDEAVEEKINKAIDWYKIDEKIWILYSKVSVDELYERLSPLVKDGGHIFICELDITNRQGWMPKSFWKWIKKER